TLLYLHLSRKAHPLAPENRRKGRALPGDGMLAHDRAAQQASRRSVYHGDPLPVPDATLITRNIEGGGRGPVRGRSRLGLRLSHRNIYQVLGCGLSPRSLAHCTSMPGNELSGTANSSGSGGGASCTAIGCNVSSSNSIKTRP